MGLVDTQISGVENDGTDNGQVRVHLAIGELIKLPVHWGNYVSLNQSPSLTGFENNADGSDAGIGLLPLANAPQSSVAYIQTQLYGRVIGVRWRRDTTAIVFSVVIDGVAYPIYKPQSLFKDQSFSMTDQECLYVVATNLPDRKHDVSIIVQGDGSNSPPKIVFFGWIVERRAGYSEIPRLLAPVYTSVPTSMTLIPFLSNATAGSLRGIRTIDFNNTTASGITVTFNTTLTPFEPWTMPIPPHGSGIVQYNPGAPEAIDSNFKWSASASGVNATIRGIY